MPRIQATVEIDDYLWGEGQIQNGTYYNWSHVIKAGIKAIRKENKERLNLNDVG